MQFFVLLMSVMISGASFGLENQSRQKKSADLKSPSESSFKSSEEFHSKKYALRINALGWAFAGRYILDFDYKLTDKITVGATAGLFGSSALTWLGAKIISEELENSEIEVDLGMSGYQVGVQGSYHLTGSALADGLLLNPFIHYGETIIDANIVDKANVSNTGNLDLSLNALCTGVRGVYQMVSEVGVVFQIGVMLGYNIINEFKVSGSLWDAATDSSTFASASTQQQLDEGIQKFSDVKITYGIELSLGYAF